MHRHPRFRPKARMDDAVIRSNYWFGALALPLTVPDVLADT
jgi:hypothetical protein